MSARISTTLQNYIFDTVTDDIKSVGGLAAVALFTTSGTPEQYIISNKGTKGIWIKQSNNTTQEGIFLASDAPPFVFPFYVNAIVTVYAIRDTPSFDDVGIVKLS